MSFRLRVDSAENLGSETCIRGRLVEGAYFGPQYIRLKDTTGKVRTATILSHGMTGALNWPVTADHDTQLELYIATPSSPLSIDTNSLVEGLGSVLPRQDSIDLSKELSNPLFWGNFSDLYMVSDSTERPYEEFLELSQDEVNSYYTDFLSPLIDSTIWPIFSLEIDSYRYAEFEWAGGAEYQNRVWIGSKASGQRALLGYDSGHFSLPGLRPSELGWLLERLEQTKAHPAAGLLLVPMCYLAKPDSLLTERLANLCARIPGARLKLASTMAGNMVERQVVSEVTWERRLGFGWCSNSQYSQRNPQSLLSVLSEAEFGFIEHFFSEVSDA
jgi:hypothetical protein